MLLGLVLQIVRNSGKVGLHERQSGINVMLVHRDKELGHKSASGRTLVFILR